MGGAISLQDSCIDKLSATEHKLLHFSYEQEHGPLQISGPANRVSSNLAFEKIYCVCSFFGFACFGHLNYYLTRRGGGSRAPQNHPLAKPLLRDGAIIIGRGAEKVQLYI